MKVFLSWSGEKSKAAAEVFRRWLPCVLQSVRPWMSDRDIGAGARWGLEVGRALEQTKFGILFVTDTNFSAPWLLFEAGALAKALDEAFVCPYLVGLEPEAIPGGPLTQFQAKRAVKGETLDLVATLNRALGDHALSDETLLTIFEKFWPDLETALRALPDGASPPPRSRPIEEMVVEILRVVRALATVVEIPRSLDVEVQQLIGMRHSLVGKMIKEIENGLIDESGLDAAHLSDTERAMLKEVLARKTVRGWHPHII